MINFTGIVFQQRAKFFKLVDIQWGKDNSFYFLPRQHDAEVGSRIKTELDGAARMVLHVGEVQQGCFPTKKISRHPSGYFHIKDVVGRGGQREKDGLVGPSFAAIDGFYVFLVACPQAIDTLVEVEKPEPTDVIAHLPDEIVPFTVQFAVWDKKKTVKIPNRPGELLGNGVIQLEIDDLDFGLVMMFIVVGKTSPEVVVPFPARTCYLVR